LGRDRLGASLLGTKRPEAPAYIFHGDIDPVVPYHLGVQLFYSWCSLGAKVVFEELIGAEHVAGSQALVCVPVALEQPLRRIGVAMRDSGEPSPDLAVVLEALRAAAASPSHEHNAYLADAS
jgi:hypothetical protein